jgi:hypothetical protein
MFKKIFIILFCITMYFLPVYFFNIIDRSGLGVSLWLMTGWMFALITGVYLASD